MESQRAGEMILTCDTCNHQIPARFPAVGKESRVATGDARCGTCGAVLRITVTVLRETELTQEQLKVYRNKTS
jgi:transcription elongation factor Elf1